VKRILHLLFLGMALTGCQEMDQIDPSSLSPREREAVSALSWLRHADAQRDAAQAGEQGDTRLYLMASRSPTLPGIPAEQAESAKASCGTRILPGSTDMVQGGTHLKLLQQAQDYAAEYNHLMLDTCLNRAD
jgi:hypothetical protein